MPDKRAIESALKSLYEKDGESPFDAPRPRKQRAMRHSPPAISESRTSNGRDAAPCGGHHDRKCSVCRHPERAEIEHEFVRWRSAEAIAKDYGIAHHSSIYRHAHAAGLFAQRATHIRLSLEPLIEQAMVVPVTADSIIRAVALCARLNDDGEWINPPKQVIYRSSNSTPRASSGDAKDARPAESSVQSRIGTRNPNRESVSNRP